VPPADDRTDQQLLIAMTRGDSRAFEALYHRHKDFVHRLACRFARDHDQALDVLQETFASLLRHPPTRLDGKLTTYLYPIVKNAALAMRRKDRRLKFGETPEPIHTPFTLPDTDVGRLLAILPEEQLEVLLMRVVDEMSVDEVAAALKVPAGTVKSRLHHALEKLRSNKDRP
jgi:RNA polymerase sigma-70 factor, ECF subfamily